MVGKLISIEGGEGAGKSTVLHAIHAQLVQAGHDVLCTREPGGTQLGEQIRALLLSPENKISTDAELLLMFASRAQLIHECILPAMNTGKTVLTDRFTDASFAYQGGGRGIAVEKIQILEQQFVGIQPNLTLLLDLGVEQGMARAHSRGQAMDRIELERNDFFQQVRSAYLQRAAEFPERIKIIDASQSIEHVVASVQACIQQWLENHA